MLGVVQVVLVFDAMGGNSRSTVRATRAGAIDVVFCAAEEADSWIVQEVRRPAAGLHDVPASVGLDTLWADTMPCITTVIIHGCEKVVPSSPTAEHAQMPLPGDEL